MGTKIDVTLDVTNNTGLTDAQAMAQLSGAVLISPYGDAITANTLSTPAAGTVRRVVQYTFSANFLAAYTTNAEQQDAYGHDTIKNQLAPQLPGAIITQTEVVS